MGNCCTKICGQKNPCTEDETKGLLHSSESKTSAKVATEPCVSPTSEEEKGHEEETKPELNESVVTKQPNIVSAETVKPPSFYSETIAALHTEISLSSEVNHNVLVETTQAPAEAGCLAIETKTEVVQEVQRIAAEASQARWEVEGQHGSPKSVGDAPALTDDAGVSATSQDLTFAPVGDSPVDETPVKEAPVEVEAEKKSSELKPPVSDEKQTLQTGELPLNEITDVKQEIALAHYDTGDVSVMHNSSTEPDSCISGQSNDLDATEKSVTKEPTTESTAKVEETCSEMTELQQETSEASETQEYLQQVDITNGLSCGVENGLVDTKKFTIEDESHADVTAVGEVLQEDDEVQKPSEEPSSKTSTNTDSTMEVKTLQKVMNSVTNEEKNEEVVQQETAEAPHNGLNSTSASAASSPIEKTRPFEPTSDPAAVETTKVKGEVIALMEETSLEPRDGAEPEPQQKEEEKLEEENEKKKEEIEKQEEKLEKQDEGIKTQEEEIEKQEETEKKVEEIKTHEEEKQKEEANVTQENEEKEDTENSETRKAEVIFSSEKVEVQLISVPSDGHEDEVLKLDESADLYLGAEEIEMGASKDKPSKAVLELTIPGVESRSSLAPAVDILAYSEREWKGNTAKSALIRKGYSEMSRSFSAVKQVRGDNYCALRATLYQLLATGTNTPTWLQDEAFLSLPEKIEAQEHLIGGWVFPPECTWGSEKDSVERLKYYLDLFKRKWQAAASCESPDERQSLCERLFQGGEEEYGLLEALKFLMLAKAIELHGNMVADQEVPVFCWLLFARDTSENPQTLLANHLSQIGFSGGVEQVEMFLLGYALQHTIQAFRLYMTDTVEFVTHYPDDHKHEWPCVCIVTEDDRHYNVPVRSTAQHQQRNSITMT